MLSTNPGRHRDVKHAPTVLANSPKDPTKRKPTTPVSESAKAVRPIEFPDAPVGLLAAVGGSYGFSFDAIDDLAGSVGSLRHTLLHR